MTFFRWLLSLPVAIMVTIGLFIMMAGLIAQTRDPAEAVPYQNVTVTAKIVDSEPKPDPIRPRPIEAAPPDIPKPRDYRQDEPPSPGEYVRPERQEFDGVGPTGPIVATPLIRHSPQYPERCRARGAQGSVLVQFDITPEGNVTNIRILESADRCFNSTVIKTVSRWKYPPEYRNGRAVMRRGVIERFSFQLVE